MAHEPRVGEVAESVVHRLTARPRHPLDDREEDVVGTGVRCVRSVS
jgi:hypothetical protein